MAKSPPPQLTASRVQVTAPSAIRNVRKAEAPARSERVQVEAPARSESVRVEAPARSERVQVEAPARSERVQVEAPARSERVQVEKDIRQRIFLPANRVATPAKIVFLPEGLAPAISNVIVPEREASQSPSEYYRGPSEEYTEEGYPAEEEGEEGEEYPLEEGEEEGLEAEIGEAEKPPVSAKRAEILIRDDYNQIRPPAIIDRPDKDFLESGAAGTQVNVNVSTAAFPIGVNPAVDAIGGGVQLGQPSQYLQLINIRTDDRKSVPLTVCFDTDFLRSFLEDVALVGTYYDFTAKLRWGVDGASVEAEIDLRDGMTISLCASSLTVSVGLNAWFGTAPPANSQVNIGGFASKGAFGKDSPQRTMIGLNPNPAANNSVVFDVPNFSRHVRILSDNGVIRARTIDLTIGTPLTIADRQLSGLNQNPNRMQLPNGVRRVIVYPNPVAVPVMLWGLAIFDLGI